MLVVALVELHPVKVAQPLVVTVEAHKVWVILQMLPHQELQTPEAVVVAVVEVLQLLVLLVVQELFSLDI
jgi:hypothetical protein